MNQIINSPTKIMEKTGWTVFLAGPMKASPRGWRNKLVKAATEMGMDNITFISPRFNTMHQPSNQVEWETQGLRMRWNKLVKPADKVYVAGDLGDSEWTKLLNGEILGADTSADPSVLKHLL